MVSLAGHFPQWSGINALQEGSSWMPFSSFLHHFQLYFRFPRCYDFNTSRHQINPISILWRILPQDPNNWVNLPKLDEKVARGLWNRSPWPFISNFLATYHKSCGAVCSCNHSLHSKGNKSELNHQGDGCHHLTVPLCTVLSFTILIFVHLPLNSTWTPWITSSLSSLLVSHAA